MKAPSGPSPLLGLVAALVVLVAGIAAAFTRDDTTSTRIAPGIVSPTRPLPTPSASTSTTRVTLAPLPTIGSSVTSTTVKPAVPTPEAAANGLWAAYTRGGRTAAARFASPAVVDALFSTPFSGEEGIFQGCRKRQGQSIFDCDYQQEPTNYTMTAEADAAGSYKIVVIAITSPETTTSSSSSE